MLRELIRKLRNNTKNFCGTLNGFNRDQWLKSQLSQINAGSKILDAGAGELKYKKFCKHLTYISQDFGSYNGKESTVGLQINTWDSTKVDIISDITNIPEPSNSYDAIMCSEVFEHIPKPEIALKEFSRLLKESGTLLLTVPVCSLTHFAPFYFYNGFSRYYFENYLPVYGFSIKEIAYNGNFFEYLAQEFRRITFMAKKYSRINPFEKCLICFTSIIVLKLLNKFSKADSGSSEMLSYGMHILAIKKTRNE